MTSKKRETQGTWKNRIVGTELMDPMTIKDNPLNWRTHPEDQSVPLEGSLSEVGWVQQVIVNQRTGHLIDGHLRVALARKTREPVPVLVVDLSEAEEALVLATLDPFAAMAKTDQEALAALLEQCSPTDSSLVQMLADLSEREGMFLMEPDDYPELANGDKSPFQQMTFTLHDSQVIQVERAIKKAKELGASSDSNENSNGNALAMIAEEYLGKG